MSGHPAIRIENDGPVSTIIIDRPEKRNAVDGPMAQRAAGGVCRVRGGRGAAASPCSTARGELFAPAPTFPRSPILSGATTSHPDGGRRVRWGRRAWRCKSL